MQEVKKKYNLLSGMAMVVGVVIGAGIFIKSSDVLRACDGNIYYALLAWLIGGLIMIASGFCFAIYATKVTKFNGLVDYIEVASNRRFAYYVAYFSGMLYYPITCANIATVASGYLLSIFGVDPTIHANAWMLYLVAFAFIALFMLLNYLSPWLADKFQISAMVIKLVPVFILIVVSLIAPIIPSLDGRSIISPFLDKSAGTAVNFGDAIRITSFAYNGWIAATALNAEMKDSKKNLPRALVGGTIAITVFYILFFLGLCVILTNQGLIDSGIGGPGDAFFKLMGKAGTILMLVFITISCLGNTNAMIFCTSRSFIAIAMRDQGLMPEKIRAVDKKGKFLIYPYLISLLASSFFLVIFYFARATNEDGSAVYPFMAYLENLDEMVCALIYCAYIVVYVYMMKNFKDLNWFARFVMPVVAIAGSIFIAFCGAGFYQTIATKTFDGLIAFAMFVVISAIFIAPAIILYHKRNKTVTSK